MLQSPRAARLILAGALLLTALAWWAARHYALEDARQRFERRTDDIQARIDRRMQSYLALLRGGVGLFAAEGEVSRDTWRRYVQTVDPGRHYPGIQGMGVSRLVAPGELAAHEAEIRAQGFPQYAVRPAGPRELYTAIVYLEPFTDRNLRAFGFDMLSEATRREAMLRARDSGEAAASGIVQLVQEDGKDVQKGFLLYLPVYRQPPGDSSPRAAPDSLWGWVYAPFRVKDLMEGILGRDTADIALRLHDGVSAESDLVFYDSRPASGAGAAASATGVAFRHARTLSVAGRPWTAVYEGRHAGAAPGVWQANLVAACGASIVLLLYGMIASLSRRKHQFEREAAHQTAAAQSRTQALTAIGELTPDAVLVFERGSDGLPRLVFTNPAFSRWFGLRPHDLLGLSEAAVDDWLKALAPASAPMPPLADGDALVTLAGPPSLALRRSMQDSERQRVYSFRDVTHETEVARLKNEFLSTAAHELRTPLASVYGFTELMLDDRLEPARRTRAAQIVHRQAGVLKHLVDELLDLARIDARRGLDFQLERIDLRRVAELAAESLLVAGERSRIHHQLGDEPMWVDVDPAKMQQAVVNLLANALKYSKPPSTVSLSLLAQERAGRGWVALRVVDAGVGMSPEQCAHAFDRFYRADPSGHVPGAGLGLSIVKEIVELQHGEVDLRSTLGAGTQVTILLPLRPPPMGAPSLPPGGLEVRAGP